MSNVLKQIVNLQKQNDGIYKSLVAKNIDFVRVTMNPDDSEEIQLQKLSEENVELKKVSNANKPPPAPKETKPQNVQNQQNQSVKKNKKKDDESESESDTETEPTKKFTQIANMEAMKISFFAGEYEEFKNLAKSQPYLFFEVTYKYNSYKDGSPSFIAKNLIKGFVKNFDDNRKLFMNCFRCYQTQSDPTAYEYVGFWIVNTPDPLAEVVELYDNFNLVQITDSNEIDKFLNQMQKLPLDENGEFVNNCIDEAYVH